jgi:branched-chain amino acid transport system ATP-binding protein
MTEPALLVDAVESGYGKTQILRGVSLRVDEGACVGLIGPNGHGKTTLLRTISGLHGAWSGTVRLRGRDITRLPARRRVDLGLVHAPQGDALFGDLSVEEHLIVALRRLRRRERQRRMRELYDIFPRLEQRRAQRARTLSGGEKRMLSIARTLLLDGKVLLIDEPSLGLSPLMVEEVYRQIGELASRGLTLLLVEENPIRLRGLAQTLYLLDRGAVVARGATDSLLRDESLLETYLGVTHTLAEEIAEAR